ncbi:hypothetical protein Hypma_012531 [Hypsizygus marmoreus]|uniref:Uncharacterized protein n=1 Tax=Hypsizygus marmoreus TaxID=39966 RepID=A0A369JLX9_HYPMA|nr:hypothetical protein Hypma_012531 [Hypsizygus marmoreus]
MTSRLEALTLTYAALFPHVVDGHSFYINHLLSLSRTLDLSHNAHNKPTNCTTNVDDGSIYNHNHNRFVLADVSTHSASAPETDTDDKRTAARVYAHVARFILFLFCECAAREARCEEAEGWMYPVSGWEHVLYHSDSVLLFLSEQIGDLGSGQGRGPGCAFGEKGEAERRGEGGNSE